MEIEWYGQSAFRLSSPEQTVMIDPFGDLSAMRERGMRIEFLEPVDEFHDRAAHVHRLDGPGFELTELPAEDAPVVVVPAAP